ncbi:MAPEG family protein [Rhodophyticola sp. CCM32]|uniref:MAPEG family protein n=1 Tax=Rhodophyticola sp. CCM32 TaxID=2916397 RepID=UPI00107F18AF|nr:MAPEG family protein [Rhodophyticola sp. CCM32]QBX99653.1 MAPEG family protein [Rhodophyticola sp. CCM32]
MTPELTALTCAGLLQAGQFLLYSVAANAQVGPGTALGPRDKRIELTGIAGRLQRALSNHFEGLTLFTLAVTVVTLSDQSTHFTAICAWTYLAARIFYVPAYAFGWSPWRSLIWFTGFAATLLMLIAALL